MKNRIILEPFIGMYVFINVRYNLRNWKFSFLRDLTEIILFNNYKCCF